MIYYKLYELNFIYKFKNLWIVPISLENTINIISVALNNVSIQFCFYI